MTDKPNKIEEIRKVLEDRRAARACGCIGPQNGEPYCPCMMRAKGIVRRNGRWVEPERDLGPVMDVPPYCTVYRKAVEGGE